MIDGAVGGVPLGMVGIRPHIERGWIKKCAQHSVWEKKQPNKVATKECGFTPLIGPGNRHDYE